MKQSWQTALSAPRRIALASTRHLKAEEINNTIFGIRQHMIDMIWYGLFCMAVIGVPASLSRALFTGWMPMYAIHILAGAIVCLTFMFRRRLPFAFRLGVMLAVFWTIGFTGALSLGLYGAGIWWLAISALVVSVAVSVRAGIATMFACTVVVIVIGSGFVNGSLSIGFDANTYIRSPSSWATLLVTITVLPTFVFVAIAGYQRATLELTHQLEQQRSEIEHLATHDALTGLPTVELARDRLTQALAAMSRRGQHVVLMFLDLDGFKSINDSLGHAAGDEVLRVVAERLRCHLRAEDTVSRQGGDEFLLIISTSATADAVLEKAREIVDLLGEPIPYEGHMMQVGVSIGIAIAPEQGEDFATLTRHADTAMYAAKRAGKNCVRMAGPMPRAATAPEVAEPAQQALEG